MKYRPVRGTHDLIGSEIDKFDKIITETSRLGQIFNFQKIETPIFEFTELFESFTFSLRRVFFIVSRI